MTQEEIQILIKDLCARLPYGVKVNHFDVIRELLDVIPSSEIVMVGYDINDYEDSVIEDIKPYLRPMSSVSEMWGGLTEEEIENPWSLFDSPVDALDYFLTNHIDFRGLIPLGLALEAPEDMYKTE